MGDLAIRRVDAPRRAFVRDKVPVVVEIDRLGDAADGLRGKIQLVDQCSEAWGHTCNRLEDRVFQELDLIDATTLQPCHRNIERARCRVEAPSTIT